MTVELRDSVPNVAAAWRSPEEIKYILVHHSATDSGNVEAFREYHVRKLGWVDVGYHYVIGNGKGAGDGEVQPGRPELMRGAHAVPRNADSIGICLVGDFTQSEPTIMQMQSLYKLIRNLMRRYPIVPDRILAHKEVDKTDCPGKLDIAVIRATLTTPPQPKIVVGGIELEGIMVGDRVYAPVRDLINALNYRVEWNSNTRTVNIISGGSNHA